MTTDGSHAKRCSCYPQEAFEVLGFSEEERMNAFRLTCGVMIFGSMQYKQKPRDEQAEVDDMEGMLVNARQTY